MASPVDQVMEDYDESLRIPQSNGRWSGPGADLNCTEYANTDMMQARFRRDITFGVPSYTSNSLIASVSTLLGNTDRIVPRYYQPVDIEAMECANADMMQALFGRDGTLEVPSYTSSSLTASSSMLLGNKDRSIPRYYQTMDIEAMGISQAHTEEVQSVESENFTYSMAPVSEMVIRNRSGPDTREWEKHKLAIYNLYIKERRSLPMVATEMAKSGFHASESMYKRKFKNWRWRKNQNIKIYGRPDRESSIPEPYVGEPLRYTSTGMFYEESLVPSSSRGSTTAVGSPRRFSLGVSMPMRHNDIDGYVNSIFFHARSWYMSSMDQGKWKITNPYEVQKDIHDDLLVGVATAVQNFDSLGNEFGGMAIMKAFKTLEKVVDDRGLFSLPAIWESFLRMRRKHRPDLAEKLLYHALQWSIMKSRHKHCYDPFVQALVGFRKIEEHHPHMLEEVIFRVYRSCIDYVTEKLSSSHLTTLSLWADYVVYVDNSSASEIKKSVDNFQLAIQRSKANNGSEGDYTLEILGLTLYVLQSRESMAEEAERVALDMLGRVDRKVEAGEKLEGKLLILWKDLRHTLGNFCHKRGELNKAVMYLEDYLRYGVVDDRDALAIEQLEKLYAKLGQPDEVQRVRQWRISSSRILLQEGDIELAEFEILDEKDDGIETDTYEDEGRDGKTLEDNDAAEIEDAEVELQILREEMKELQQRIAILEKRADKNKGKKDTSSRE